MDLPFPAPGLSTGQPSSDALASVLGKPMNNEIPPVPKPKKMSLIAKLVMDHFMRQQKAKPPQRRPMPQPQQPMLPMLPQLQQPMPQPPMGAPNGPILR